MSTYCEALIKRVQFFRVPVVVEDGISHGDAESALDNFDGLESHVENEYDFCETQVELVRLCESGRKFSSARVDESDFRDFSSSRGLAVLTNKVGRNEIAEVAVYNKALHRHLLKNEDTQTTA